MQCPSCKEPIDNDSRYCDQCGGKILICPKCFRPGKGKWCAFDREEMIEPGAASPQTAQPVQPIQPVQPVQPVQSAQAPPQVQPMPSAQAASASPAQTPPQVATPPAQAASGGDSVTFIGNGISFEAKDGNVIGRNTGEFVNIFSNQPYVSGTHCKILKVNGVWHIQDLGSSNGTSAQGNKLAPNVPCPLSNNAAVRIANLDFTVTFKDSGSTKGGGSTVQL